MSAACIIPSFLLYSCPVVFSPASGGGGIVAHQNKKKQTKHVSNDNDVAAFVCRRVSTATADCRVGGDRGAGQRSKWYEGVRRYEARVQAAGAVCEIAGVRTMA